ncbi:unnamed protein product [Brassicogethes aeneus]|uniref:Large ribosomal subunit protein uL10m n=1 Tax=Brassicogethes aeneus TaxID=1431903 RepID=A0A9P0B7J1_BRAAE|nr:unnamed protein product [Brassicogethes aeneus]
MALFNRKALCDTITPLVQIKRFRGKINIQRPKQAHYEKAVFLEATKPWFVNPNKDKPMSELCKGSGSAWKKEDRVNPFQQIIAGELKRWLTTSRLVAFYHMNPMNAETQFQAYVMFKKEKMHYKNYGRKTLEMAVEGTKYETLLEFYVSHSMTVFSPEPELKKLLKITKKFPQLVLLAGIYDGKLLSKDEFMYYSSIPNLESAQAGLVHTLNSAGSSLVSKLNSHQNSLVGNLEARAEQLQGEQK